MAAPRYQPPEPTDAQRAALELLAGAERILLTGHERPDGDCLGSEAALARILNARGQSAFVYNSDPPDEHYAEVVESAEFLVDDGGPLPDHDLVVMLDGSDLSRTGALAHRLREAPSDKLVVDHHLHAGGAWWDAAFVDTTASATGVLVRRIAAHLDAAIDAGTARALFTTLVTDTGWFKYSNTDVETLSIAAELVGVGVRPAEVFGDLFQRQAAGHPRSLAAALARTTYYADGRLVVVDLPLGPDGRSSDVDGDVVLDVLRSVESVEVALVLREIGPARCKLSARSKGAFDVQKLALAFGGGGHAKAAGATIEQPLIEARVELVEEALEQLARTAERRSEPRSAADAARRTRGV
ncbi:MAG: DHHA1 domain-containing protein [Planctomycetota bacterium]